MLQKVLILVFFRGGDFWRKISPKWRILIKPSWEHWMSSAHNHETSNSRNLIQFDFLSGKGNTEIKEFQKMSVLNSREIDSLPDEILFKIFSYLDLVDLITCESICQKWSNITNIPKLKRQCKFWFSKLWTSIKKLVNSKLIMVLSLPWDPLKTAGLLKR